LSTVNQPYTTYAPEAQKSNVRWMVCGLLFLATTINYMDRSVFSLIEPELHKLPFMEWNDSSPQAFNDHFGNVLIFFQIAYGIGLLVSGRIIDKLGTKFGYALAIALWGIASMSHVFVGSVAGFCLARFMLGIGESGNFPAAIKATSEWFPTEERALATGIWNSGANFSSLIAPILIPFVTAIYGWRAAFITTGSMGMLWLLLWLLFPYNKLRRTSTQTQANLELPLKQYQGSSLSYVLKSRGLWAFAIAKGLTDPIWWFYLFWLPKYFHENYNLDLKHVGLPLILIYCGSSVGSIGGGYVAGHFMRRGMDVNKGRKLAMLICASFSIFAILVPVVHSRFPNNVWLAVGLLAIAAAAHQGWSANLFATPSDIFPSTTVSTVVGIGGAAGAVGGALFTWFTKTVWIHHPFLIFLIAGCAYLTSLAIFNFLVPQLGHNLNVRVDEPTMP
jgi:MFS transporter, ACS family, hexuronate transporter